ncbi:nose resistant to fluoxetine protein 6-like [Mercenaria mercenaria]|uniref:nose resistant to fluoxetine protein 6-like n=1 Tax=Mercenaria mercenaria TaxID=6596 RepID=UPI00234F8A02|nr:nose resistant to fluoxetine protein 6-like [Mercenaria mercenaria]
MMTHALELTAQVQRQVNENNASTISVILENNLDGILALGGEFLASVLDAVSWNVSTSCLTHSGLFLQALLRREKWALKMIDAIGKPPNGLLDGHFTWLGNYDECIAVEAIRYNDTIKKIGPSEAFTGKYCLASFPLGTTGNSLTGPPMFSIGMCLPETCSSADVATLIITFISLLPFNVTLPSVSAVCQEKTLPYTDAAIAVIVICTIFAIIIITATLYDAVNQNIQSKEMDTSNGQVPNNYTKGQMPNEIVAEQKIEKFKCSDLKSRRQGKVTKLLLSFSVYSNAPKLLNTKQLAGTLSSVNGIRFISTSWVILCHTYMMGLPVIENVAVFLPKMLKRFTFQAVVNAFVSVDTFFVLSGLLVAYLSLREMRKVGGPRKFNWFLFYFHRFWRLTPPYMLLFMLYVPTFKYWSDGPLWLQQGLDKNDCKNSWWANLLYINNIVNEKETCMGWSWYLANDMQFFVISPFMLIPLYYSPVLGGLSCLALVTVSVISRALISKHYEFNANLLFSSDMDDIFEIYYKPWSRVGPYAVGVFTGYMLYRTECRIKMSKFLNFVGWTMATGVAIAVLYGLYTPDGSTDRLSVDVSALYNATSRIAWAICIAWVIFSCASGYGGPVNAYLAWGGFVPLSRLTYCAYLVHPIVITLQVYSRRTLEHWSDIELIYRFLGHMCITYATAFVISLAFESPMIGLEKVLLGRKKRS